MSRSRFLKPDAELRRLELELDLLGKLPREKWDERLKDIGDRFATRRPPPAREAGSARRTSRGNGSRHRSGS